MYNFPPLLGLHETCDFFLQEWLSGLLLSDSIPLQSVQSLLQHFTELPQKAINKSKFLQVVEHFNSLFCVYNMGHKNLIQCVSDSSISAGLY